jgi:hypothetical protein
VDQLEDNPGLIHQISHLPAGSLTNITARWQAAADLLQALVGRVAMEAVGGSLGEWLLLGEVLRTM